MADDAVLAPRTVAVVGSGKDEHDTLARGVGQLLARLGVNLLTGGGRGVMTSVSRAYVGTPRECGICIGVIPCASESERSRPMDGYPNEFVELVIRTHLPHSGKWGKDVQSRNHINVLTADVIVALPGGDGTDAEISLAVEYDTPIIAYAKDANHFEGVPESVPRATSLKDVEIFLQRILI